MKISKGKKIMAILLAALMVIGVIPMDWAIQRAAAADAKVYTFDATTLTAAADKEALSGKVADDFITVFGEVTKRTSSSTGAVTSTEIAKQGKGGYEFTITGTATFKVDVSSTGGSNESRFHLVNANGEDIADSTGAKEVSVTGSASGRKTVTYELTAGTYKFMSVDWEYETGKARGGRVYKMVIEEAVVASKTTTYAFDATTLTAAADKEALTGKVADDFVAVFGEVTKRTSSSTGAVTSTEIAKQGKGGYEFTITGTATFKVDVSSTGGSNESRFHLVNASGEDIADSTGAKEVSVTGSASGRKTVTYELTAGTYKFMSVDWEYETGKARGGRVYSFEITETTGGERPSRAEWSKVAAPVISSVEVKNGVVTVKYNGVVGYDGADEVKITMTDAAGNAKTVTVAETSDSGKAEFTPSASGKYTFSIVMSRKDEEDKKGKDEVLESFVLPLKTSSISSAYNKGNGVVEVEWSAVTEATSYVLEYSEDGSVWAKKEAGSKLLAEVSGLTAGKEYSFRVVAVRGTDSTTSDVVKCKVVNEAEVKWSYAAFGNGVDTKNNGYTGSANEGKVTVYSENGKGKIVPASTDGLAFYYTTVPSNMNFTLRAKVTIDSWTLSNGQEGFGLMAADRVGTDGQATPFWNNSYMASATKVEYYYDTEKGEVTTDTSATKITMKLGIGAQVKSGVTPENLAKFDGNDTETINKYFNTQMSPLDTSAGVAAANEQEVYTNIIGNATKEVAGTNPKAVTEMYLTIQKNNTGYFVSYEDMEGNVVTKKYYETTTLEQLDKDNVYVGFYASRNARATFSDIKFTTVSPENDAPAEERPVEKIAVNTTVSSTTATGTPDYEFTFSANCDGKLTIKAADGSVIAENIDVKANVACNPAKVVLVKGKNSYKLIFTPDADYVPGESQVMVSYDPVEIDHTVTYKTYGNEGESIWVAPNATGTGSKSNPMSIYEAVKYVQPGQTIVIKEGTYLLDKTVKVERGIDGTADKKIYMIADPAASTRPVFDFQSTCAGMILAGDYWVFKGFDVTKSGDGQKGIQVSGSYNLLDSINTYHNGNTGIQISRYLTTDGFENWPSYNTILNCTSYGNADAGYEDADGFAAKLTCGEGNVFDGCIAHHNADDGWDLFAKVQTGSIGAVTIKNSVAYANGYLEDGTNAGNGNGFKMGGDSMSGKHILENCVAYDNKAKGIDSNSCPDIIVKNSISFNNHSYNVALYTNNAANTDFSVDGVISFRTDKLDQTENIKPVGSQDANKIYKATNYFWDAANKISANTEGATVSKDWFVSLDTSVAPTRNADGTINMHGLLQLTDKAAAGMEGLGSGTPSTPTDAPESIAPTTASIANTKEEIEKMFGAGASIALTVKDLVVSAEDAAKFENALTGKFKIGQYMDITLTKTVDGVTTNVTKIENGKLKIALVIPESLIADKSVVRTYKIARLHDGVVTIIDGSFDKATNTFTFETDAFSAYAIIYEDVAAPNTGDNTPVALYATFAFMSIVALAAVTLFEKKRLAK